ncbi:N-6 DNA methylase [Thermosynechococcus sp. WL15]|nr:N-6 DNA methylase [Thermosynechococcus sp. PKX95]WNC35582.1 N-6 DNA methylase [Thermosynechococcus sp. PKX91]WNC38103.1 N-6 DNA methylase [Thermosynechococcus sp. WL11]WNC40624.1 N-6 DNA methylase [Thermosynechococcus sp. WL17]WNC43144.1 N-6 DNA methylase [Thermosynechococcus sp. WL15]
MNHGTRDRIHPKQGALNPPFQTDPQAEPLPMGRDSGLTNPPFGVDWKKQQKEIKREHEKQGFSAGLPRVNDGSLPFLQHMIAKFEPVQPGTHRHG